MASVCCEAKATEKHKQDAASIQKLQNDLSTHKQQRETEKKKMSSENAKAGF